MQSFNKFINEAKGSEMTVSLRYASDAIEAFRDGRWEKMGGKMKGSDVYVFKKEDDMLDFYNTLIHDWDIPESEITIEESNTFETLHEATVEMDAMDPDNKEFLKFLKKHGVKIIDKQMEGPSGSQPVITMQGTKKDLIKVLSDEEFGWADPDLAEYIEESLTEASDDFAGWIAFFNGKKLEITKDEAKDLWDAKKLAIDKLKVPKSKVGILAIAPAYNESVEVSEAKITLKRQYTENYPAITVGKAARIRNKMLEAVADGKITQEEFNGILREFSKDTARWIRRNSNLFNVSEDGISLSKFGKKILSSITVNEETPTEEITESYTDDDINMSYGFYGTINTHEDDKTTKQLFDRSVKDLMKEFKLSEKEALELLNSKMGRKAADQIIDGQAKTAVEGFKTYYGKSLDKEIKNTITESNNINNMKNQFVFESFNDFVDSLNLNEAFKSSIITSVLTGKGKGVDKKLAQAFYNFTKLSLDQVEDEDIIVTDPITAYKGKQTKSVIFYISDNEKPNPHAPSDAYYSNKTIPGGGYILAAASGDNKFYDNGWASRWSGDKGLTFKQVDNNPSDSIGISKKYSGWDATGLYNVKRIAEVADRAIIFNLDLLSQKYSTVAKRSERAAAKAGATAFKSDKDFKKENEARYREILATKAAALPLDAMIKDAIDTLSNQIKDALSSGKTNKYNEVIVGTNPRGSDVKVRDAANHMSNILDDYSRYVSYTTQAEEEVKAYGTTSSYYERESKTYAKYVKDKIDQIADFSYGW